MGKLNEFEIDRHTPVPKGLGTWKVLIISDRHENAFSLSRYLDEFGYLSEVEMSPKDPTLCVRTRAPDVVIFDLLDPKCTSCDACQRVRDAGDTTPAIVVGSGHDAMEQILALELGADFFVANDANPRLTLAALRALARRAGKPSVTTSSDLRRSVGGLTIDPITRTVHFRGQHLALATGEFDLLWVLVQAAGAPVKSEEIVKILQARPTASVRSSVRFRIFRLRACFAKAGISEDALRYVGTRAGYVLDPALL
jgi:DNA-binding response OmpR family regulator